MKKSNLELRSPNTITKVLFYSHCNGHNLLRMHHSNDVFNSIQFESDVVLADSIVDDTFDVFGFDMSGQYNFIIITDSLEGVPMKDIIKLKLHLIGETNEFSDSCTILTIQEYLDLNLQIGKVEDIEKLNAAINAYSDSFNKLKPALEKGVIINKAFNSAIIYQLFNIYSEVNNPYDEIKKQNKELLEIKKQYKQIENLKKGEFRIKDCPYDMLIVDDSNNNVLGRIEAGSSEGKINKIVTDIFEENTLSLNTDTLFVIPLISDGKEMDLKYKHIASIYKPKPKDKVEYIEEYAVIVSGDEEHDDIFETIMEAEEYIQDLLNDNHHLDESDITCIKRIKTEEECELEVEKEIEVDIYTYH